MTRLAPLGIICVALACQAGEAGAVTHAQRAAVVRALEQQTDEFDQKIKAMEKSANGFRTFMRCVKLVPVSQYGDPDHAFGFEYDDRNGTGVDYRPALGLHRAKRWPDYAFLDFAKRKECRSAATVPGGTADNARLSATVRPLRTQAGVRGWRAPHAGERDREAHGRPRPLPARPRTEPARPLREPATPGSAPRGHVRALRRVGVVPLVGARHRVRRP